jgi:hypothetical protein
VEIIKIWIKYMGKCSSWNWRVGFEFVIWIIPIFKYCTVGIKVDFGSRIVLSSCRGQGLNLVKVTGSARFVWISARSPIRGRLSLLVLFSIGQFVDDFTRMSRWIEMICMFRSLLLWPLFSRMTRVHIFLLVIVVVLVLVKMFLRRVAHS